MTEDAKQQKRTGHCYWCGGETADGGSIRIQVNEGEPKRETCPGCLRDWPPEQINEGDY